MYIRQKNKTVWDKTVVDSKAQVGWKCVRLVREMHAWDLTGLLLSLEILYSEIRQIEII